MAEYTFTPLDLSKGSYFYKSLIAAGITDAQVSVNGLVKVRTDIGTQQQCQDALSAALSGTLFVNKLVKIGEIGKRSLELSSQGFSYTTIGADTGLFPLDEAKNDFSFYESVVTAVQRTIDDGAPELPQMIPTIDGAVMFTSIADIIGLAAENRHRNEYIYTSPITINGADSELLLTAKIEACTTQAELDLIQDLRV